MTKREAIEQCRRKLLARRLCADALPIITSGLYVIFLVEPGALPMLKLHSDGVLYIGMTTDDSGARNHFLSANSGFSSPRRSLGALLKKQLRLSVIPRGPGQSRSNWTNYRFPDEGEARLTRWMVQNLRANHVALPNDSAEIEEVEAALIVELTPPLNIRGAAKGENRAVLESARRACREEARKRPGNTRQRITL